MSGHLLLPFWPPQQFSDIMSFHLTNILKSRGPDWLTSVENVFCCVFEESSVGISDPVVAAHVEDEVDAVHTPIEEIQAGLKDVFVKSRGEPALDIKLSPAEEHGGKDTNRVGKGKHGDHSDMLVEVNYLISLF